MRKHSTLLIKRNQRMFACAPIIYAFLFFFLSLPLAATAARFSISSEPEAIRMNDQVRVDLMLDTEGESINAVGGTLTFDGGMLRADDLRDGDSIISFWVERPSVQKISGTDAQGNIKFSGIIPGGYEGKKGKIFSLVFHALRLGNAALTLENPQALRNDGQGSEAVVHLTSGIVRITQDAPSSSVPLLEDHEPPESFTPVVTRDPSVFDNKLFLVFATQDKISGIDHYKVSETKDKNEAKWITAESPSLLQDQTRASWILVKVVDKQGNMRIAEIAPLLQNVYQNNLFWGIIIAVFIALVISRMVWKKARRKKHI